MVLDACLLPVQNLQAETHWLEQSLLVWLDTEFLAEALHPAIAQRAAQVYAHQRMEGENLIMGIHIALLVQMRHFDFGKTACSEFVIANAVAELLMARATAEEV